MLEDEYKNYLVSDCVNCENINIKQVIVRLFKNKEIDLITAKRLRIIYDTLVKMPNTEAFKLEEELNYKTNNKLEQLKLELVFLLEKLIIKNIEKHDEHENISKFRKYLDLAISNNLSLEDIDNIKKEILFSELDNGYDFKFLVYADNYLKTNIKRYYK